jgi:hypothetical protein
MYNALLFGPYSQFQNDAVKHGKREEEFTENDIGFMIYITGTFMRLLLKLEQNDRTTTGCVHKRVEKISTRGFNPLHTSLGGTTTMG